MNYEDILMRLKCPDDIEKCTRNNCVLCGYETMKDAASAIETLLAERDALMKDVVMCDTCLHVKECYLNELRRTDCANSNRGHWKWRGPQKEGGA